MTKRISQLPALTLPALTDQFAVNQGGVSKRMTLGQVRELGVFNVKDYGAIGDDVADDTAAIQAAVDATVDGRRGGTVYFPAGNYRITSTVTLPDPDGGFQDSISLIGASPQYTTLTWRGTGSGFVPMLRILGQNVATYRGLALSNQAAGGRGETVGIWFTDTANTGGTAGGSSIFELMSFGGFSRGIILGDAQNSISEVLFNLCIFANNDYGCIVVNQNSLDVTFVLLEMNGNAVGIYGSGGGCIQVYGGSASSNDLDFHFTGGGGNVLSGFRSELQGKVLKNDAGTTTVQGCTFQAPTSVDKVSIETTDSLNCTSTNIEGKITAMRGVALSLIGCHLGNGGTGDATSPMVYPIVGVDGGLKGTTLLAHGCFTMPTFNGNGNFPNRMTVFDASNVEHGWVQDAAVDHDTFDPLPTGAMIFQPAAAHPPVGVLGSGMGLYTKGGKLVIPYSNGGTLTFLTIPLDGTTTTWTQTTTPP